MDTNREQTIIPIVEVELEQRAIGRLITSVYISLYEDSIITLSEAAEMAERYEIKVTLVKKSEAGK